MSEVIWSPAAADQLQSICAYVEQFNPKAAEELGRRLLAASNSLLNFPYRGRPVAGTSMRELLIVSPYIIR